MLNAEEKVLKDKYICAMAGVSKGQDTRMYNAYANEIYKVVRLSNGQYVGIKRYSIKTEFCYGYDTDKSEEIANKHSNAIQTNPSVFIQENLNQIESDITKFEKCDLYSAPEYPTNLLVHYILPVRRGEQPDTSRIKGKIFKLTEQDRLRIIDGYKESREDMKKRLNTYLKKYGLSKLNVWTYLRD